MITEKKEKVSMKKKKPQAHRIVGVRFTDKTYKQVIKLAETERLAVSTMLRRLIEQYIETKKAA